MVFLLLQQRTLTFCPYKQTRIEGGQGDETHEIQNTQPLKHGELQIDLSNGDHAHIKTMIRSRSDIDEGGDFMKILLT